MGTATAAPNPFPGLRPFREDEEHLFFGRENQVDRMVDKLAAKRFLAVIGSSGSGKSSLVNCGLRPALHRGLMSGAGTAWRVAQFRPGGNPMEPMASALSETGLLFTAAEPSGMPLQDIVAATLAMSNLGLADLYEQARVPEGSNLLIVVDQFEELFRYRKLQEPGGSDRHGASGTAASFVNLLLEAHAQREHPIYVVLTMRSDFLGDCTQFYGLPEAINEGQYLVPRMTREERRAAIAGPARVAGAEMSPLLLTRVINETGDNPDQLSILQHALNRTWARWQHHGEASRELAVEDYEDIGTMAHALDRHAERAFGELGDARERLVCEKVFRALTDRGTDARGIRRPIQLDRLRRIVGASEQQLSAVLDAFRKPSRSFLMPPVPEALAPDTIIDISHESLMRVWGRLTLWTEEEAECARMFRRIQDTAALNRAGKAGLWQDPDLQLARDWRTRVQPTPEWSELYAGGLGEAISFIEKSKCAKDEADAKAEAELLWRTRFVVPGVVVLALGYALTSSAIRRPVEDMVSEQAANSVDKFTTTLASGAVAATQQHGQAVLYSTLGLFVATSLPVIPFFLVGIALHRWGRKQYLEFKVPRLIRRAKTAADKALLAEPVPKPVSAIDALGTSYASFGRRMLASLIDFVAFIALWFAAVIVVALGDQLIGTNLLDGDAGTWATLGLALVFSTLLEAKTITSRYKGTPGMMALRVIATNTQGERLPFRNAALRRLLRPLSYYCMLGVLIQPLTKRRQALHDLLTGTVVLRRPGELRE